mgnify:CR=1 FL=1
MDEKEKELDIDEELLYNENEMEDLKKTIAVLKEQKDELIQNKLPSNTDKYAVDYVKTLNEHDLSYLTTKEVFDNYLAYRRHYTKNGENLLSVRMLNSVIRKYFPRARVNHSNKLKKNTYFWVFDYED